MTHPARLKGFTLLELLVVVFMIGILVTMFTLAVGVTGGDRELEREVDRLAALLDLASDEAVMEAREFGLKFYPDAYEFSTWYEEIDTSEDDPAKRDKSRWTVLTEDELLSAHELANDIEIELEIEGRVVVLKNADSAVLSVDDEVERYEPQLFVFSSGDMSPFAVKFRRRFESDGITLSIGEDGSIERREDRL